MYNEKEKTEAKISKPMPTLNGLKTDLASKLSGHRLPIMMPQEPSQAVDWWLKMQFKHNEFESPRKMFSKSDNGRWVWIWPFADRIKYNLNKFLGLDQDFQKLICSAREDKIYWNGDERDFFMKIISETFAMREIRSEERRVGKECRSRWSQYH